MDLLIIIIIDPANINYGKETQPSWMLVVACFANVLCGCKTLITLILKKKLRIVGLGGKLYDLNRATASDDFFLALRSSLALSDLIGTKLSC